jgi:hypothetical protein
MALVRCIAGIRARIGGLLGRARRPPPMERPVAAGSPSDEQHAVRPAGEAKPGAADREEPECPPLDAPGFDLTTYGPGERTY